MDAAAELDVAAFGLAGVDGVGFWEKQNPWPGDQFEVETWESSISSRSFCRQPRPSSFALQLPYKRVRNVPAETSGEDQEEEEDYGARFDDVHGAFTGPECGDSLHWGAAQGMGAAFSEQAETRTINNFSGEFDSDTGPVTPNSSGSPSAGRGRGTGTGTSTGSVFFKTKLCTKFRAGTCPYNSNCNFAHGMEELRKPPPGWEEIAAVQDAERGFRTGQPIMSSTGSGNSCDTQRFHKTRPCKKYYSEGGCPYGDRCNFLHDDQARERESNAISLGPGPAGSPSSGIGAPSERPPNWKTRLCNKWETTGHCPFGQKCHFAHGLTELQTHGGFHVESKNGATSGSGTRNETKQVGRTSKIISDNGSLHVSTLYAADGHSTINISRHGVGVLSMQIKKQVVESKPNWRGRTDEISTIYGDWIEEDEWEQTPALFKATTDQPTGKFSEFKEESFQLVSKPVKRNVVSESGQMQNSQHANFKRFKKGEDGWVRE